jgi:hypothetical protein
MDVRASARAFVFREHAGMMRGCRQGLPDEMHGSTEAKRLRRIRRWV